jgi:methyl-accepting chemotaxis protein
MVLALFAFVGAVGLVGGGKLKALNDDFMHHSVQELEAVSALRHHLGQLRLLEKQMVIDYEDSEAVGRHREAWQAQMALARKALETMGEGEADEDNALAAEAIERLDAYRDRSNPVLNSIQAGNYDNARVADRMMARAKEEVGVVEQRAEQIVAIVQAEAEATRVAFAKQMQWVLLAFVGALAVVVVVVVPLTLLNSSSITSPISYAAKLASAIAEGDLTKPIRVEGRDEAAQLLAALSRMQDSLRGIVGRVHTVAQTIRAASHEVAKGNADLSQRTEQTASSLQQTAASMEQLTGTVQASAGSAEQARALATEAATVAARGGEVVAQVVRTMDDINQSSHRIADIIGTIDGIAFQTNILALNAAVEAARAGEQGRGFAVVAGEVRSLAQRSAAAAREIKALIGASVERVESGSRQVGEAGTTMNHIVQSVGRVTQIVSAISQGAGEQSAGIGSVNGAVSELDRMTQQNAALVEQSAAAAESLQSEAQALTETVAAFRLPVAA